MTTITHQRPMGTVSVEVNEVEGKTTLTRSATGWLAPAPSTLEVSTPAPQAVAMLTAWAEGAVAQDALSEWSVQIREWLITGFEPGHEMNPYHH